MVFSLNLQLLFALLIHFMFYFPFSWNQMKELLLVVIRWKMKSQSDFRISKWLDFVEECGTYQRQPVNGRLAVNWVLLFSFFFFFWTSQNSYFKQKGKKEREREREREIERETDKENVQFWWNAQMGTLLNTVLAIKRDKGHQSNETMDRRGLLFIKFVKTQRYETLRNNKYPRWI